MTNLVIKDTYRHKDTEVWNILGGKLRGGGAINWLGGHPLPPPLPHPRATWCRHRVFAWYQLVPIQTDKYRQIQTIGYGCVLSVFVYIDCLSYAVDINLPRTNLHCEVCLLRNLDLIFKIYFRLAGFWCWVCENVTGPGSWLVWETVDCENHDSALCI